MYMNSYVNDYKSKWLSRFITIYLAICNDDNVYELVCHDYKGKWLKCACKYVDNNKKITM